MADGGHSVKHYLTFSSKECLLVVEVPVTVVDPVSEGQQVVVDGQEVLVAAVQLLVTHCSHARVALVEKKLTSKGLS